MRDYLIISLKIYFWSKSSNFSVSGEMSEIILQPFTCLVYTTICVKQTCLILAN